MKLSLYTFYLIIASCITCFSSHVNASSYSIGASKSRIKSDTIKLLDYSTLTNIDDAEITVNGNLCLYDSIDQTYIITWRRNQREKINSWKIQINHPEYNSILFSDTIFKSTFRMIKKGQRLYYESDYSFGLRLVEDNSNLIHVILSQYDTITKNILTNSQLRRRMDIIVDSLGLVIEQQCGGISNIGAQQPVFIVSKQDGSIFSDDRCFVLQQLRQHLYIKSAGPFTNITSYYGGSPFSIGYNGMMTITNRNTTLSKSSMNIFLTSIGLEVFRIQKSIKGKGWEITAKVSDHIGWGQVKTIELLLREHYEVSCTVLLCNYCAYD
jgi:hypothetical protein